MVKLSRQDWLSLAVAVGGPMIGGQIASLACIKDVKGWYTRIRKPRWTPPNWVFGAVWPILYLGQGVSSWLVWRTKGIKRGWPLGLYGAQLVLNLLWQPLMFKLHRPDVATWESCLLLGVATSATAVMADSVSGKKAKATVITSMGTYVAWLGFATALSAAIARDNPKAHLVDASPAAPGETTTPAITTKDPIKSAGKAALERQKGA